MIRLLAVLGGWLMLTACAQSGPYVELGGERFSVELATTPEDQRLGLMFRDELADDAGMLFIFEREQPRSFWMKNTRIPLDIIYIDAALNIVSIAAAQPCRTQRCVSYPSAGPAQYVLELNQGTANRLGVGPGDAVAVFPETMLQ